MKKLAVFIAFICLCVGTMLIQEDSIFDISGLSSVCFVSEGEGGDIETLQYNYTFMNPEEARVKGGNINAVGLICYFEGVEAEQLIDQLSLCILKEERVENMTILYGYTPKSHSCIWLENKKINTQIVVRDSDIVIGFPSILSGF